ncbi:guanine nucleotide-binding protein G(I)/G(S)/G(O) subunit gamma-T2 isoform X4 [Rhineura floridana]|uniref:guanine nucleotide-binding protein G(I)/G(S)/G(O) subunit gamma-T2 isoform X4 n=1 Tax=Rhineura floridana TaxID=261503 RepID=UPI002AC83574|nr:guanine nucleotide-binding protein G(I)/G(S)/G(O) subunit gamma-T2 isoform X4 [Rhineura floridana]
MLRGLQEHLHLAVPSRAERMRLEFSRGDGNEETGDAHPTAHLKTPAPEQRARGQGAVPHWNPPGNSLGKMAQDMTEKELIKMELDQLKKEVKLERQMVSKIAKELKEYIESTAAEDPLLKGGDVWTPLLAFHPRTKELDTGLHRDKEKEDKLSFRTSSPIPVL